MPPERSTCSAPVTFSCPPAARSCCSPTPRLATSSALPWRQDSLTPASATIWPSAPQPRTWVSNRTPGWSPCSTGRRQPQTFVQGPGTGGAAEAGDRFGAALGAGFLDNNGGPWELAVGAPGEDLGEILNTGAVNILYGAASGLVGQGQVLVQGSPGVADTAEPDDSFG